MKTSTLAKLEEERNQAKADAAAHEHQALVENLRTRRVELKLRLLRPDTDAELAAVLETELAKNEDEAVKLQAEQHKGAVAAQAKLSRARREAARAVEKSEAEKLVESNSLEDLRALRTELTAKGFDLKRELSRVTRAVSIAESRERLRARWAEMSDDERAEMKRLQDES